MYTLYLVKHARHTFFFCFYDYPYNHDMNMNIIYLHVKLIYMYIEIHAREVKLNGCFRIYPVVCYM